MKKVFSGFAILLIMLTAGCSKQENSQAAPPPISTSFTANISATYGETEMTATLTQNAAEDFEISFLTPEVLSPLSIAYKSGVCTVTYDDLSFETDLNRFPQTEMGTILTDAISDAVQGIDIQTTYSEGIWTYKGTGERGVFTLTRDAETGAWMELTVDGAQLKVVFSEFKIS